MTVAIDTPYAKLVAERQAARRSNRRAYWSYVGILAFVLLTTIAVLGHAGSVLNYAFPVMAAGLGGVLFVYRRATYVAYTWWIWLASPEIRRLVDFQTHWHTISPVMLSPLLVTLFALIAVLRRPGILLRRAMLPLGMLILVTTYAFVVGAFTNGFLPAAYEWGTWLIPLSFGIFLVMDETAAQENRQAFVNALVAGLIVMGAYGIYQYFHLPPWDAAWLTNSKLHSQGQAIAEQVRIFGPLNDSGSFGAVLAGSLIFVLITKGWMRIAAGALGVPAFLLAQERQFWGAWVIAAIFVVWRLGGKARLRIIIVGIVVAAIATPILSVGPASHLVSKRFSTLSHIQNDHSATARRQLYGKFLITAISQPLGTGYGSFGVSAKLVGGQNVDFDSGIMEIPFVYGWVGGLIFGWALIQMSLRILSNYLRTREPVTIAATGIFFGMMAALLFGQVFAGPQGIVVWAAAGLAFTTPVSSRARTRLR